MTSDYIDQQSEYISVSNGATTVGRWLEMKHATGFSFHVENTTNTGTITIQASNDPRCDLNHPDTANANSDDISADLTIPTVGGTMDGYINVSNFRMRYVRLTWTNSSGTSAFKCYAHVK